MERLVPTPQGEARVVVRRARSPIASLLLTHGAGGGIGAADLARIAEDLPGLGISVSLVEMPWRVQGKRLAPRPALIDEAYLAVVAGVRGRSSGPWVIGGRSAGARSACRIGRHVGADGVLALSFPLHPPGKPERSRLEELAGAGIPALVVQGERDPFGRPEEFPGDVDLAVVPAADHGMKVPKKAVISQADALGLISESVLEWIVRDVAGNRAG